MNQVVIVDCAVTIVATTKTVNWCFNQVLIVSILFATNEIAV